MEDFYPESKLCPSRPLGSRIRVKALLKLNASLGFLGKKLECKYGSWFYNNVTVKVHPVFEKKITAPVVYMHAHWEKIKRYGRLCRKQHRCEKQGKYQR
jgi:hypothetical protein